MNKWLPAAAAGIGSNAPGAWAGCEVNLKWRF